MSKLDEFWETPAGLAAADIAHALTKHPHLSEDELAVALRGGVMLATPFGKSGIARERRVLQKAAHRAVEFAMTFAKYMAETRINREAREKEAS